MSGTNGNGNNGHGTLPAVVEPLSQAIAQAPAPVYTPTVKDWALLDAFSQLKSERKPATQRNLAFMLGIKQPTLCVRLRKLAATPGWQDWWIAEMRALVRAKWAEAVASQAMRAADDLETFRALAPYLEPARENFVAGPSAPRPDQTNNGFVVHIHK
jgi:hypothetical protein